MATEEIGLDISTEGADTVHKLLNNSTNTRFKTVKCCGKEKVCFLLHFTNLFSLYIFF